LLRGGSNRRKKESGKAVMGIWGMNGKRLVSNWSEAQLPNPWKLLKRGIVLLATRLVIVLVVTEVSVLLL